MSEGRRPPRSLVLRIVAEESARVPIPPELIFSRDRRHPIVNARWQVCQRLRRLGYSLCGIGAALMLDHTTVIHALRQVTPGKPRVLRPRSGPPALAKQIWVPRRDTRLPWHQPTVTEVLRPKAPPMTIVVSRAAMMGGGRRHRVLDGGMGA